MPETEPMTVTEVDQRIKEYTRQWIEDHKDDPNPLEPLIDAILELIRERKP